MKLTDLDKDSLQAVLDRTPAVSIAALRATNKAHRDKIGMNDRHGVDEDRTSAFTNAVDPFDSVLYRKAKRLHNHGTPLRYKINNKQPKRLRRLLNTGFAPHKKYNEDSLAPKDTALERAQTDKLLQSLVDSYGNNPSNPAKNGMSAAIPRHSGSVSRVNILMKAGARFPRSLHQLQSNVDGDVLQRYGHYIAPPQHSTERHAPFFYDSAVHFGEVEKLNWLFTHGYTGFESVAKLFIPDDIGDQDDFEEEDANAHRIATVAFWALDKGVVPITNSNFLARALRAWDLWMKEPNGTNTAAFVTARKKFGNYVRRGADFDTWQVVRGQQVVPWSYLVQQKQGLRPQWLKEFRELIDNLPLAISLKNMVAERDSIRQQLEELRMPFTGEARMRGRVQWLNEQIELRESI